MALQKIPVERGEGTRVRAGRLRRIEAAPRAVVAHALDVFAGRDVGLGGEVAAVRVLRHADDVGQLDPLHRIDVDRQIPLVHPTRLHPEHQGVEPRDHQPLDVVGVAELKRLPDRVAQAGHLGVTRPEKRRQRAGRAEGVDRRVVRHAQPVDAAHEFPPTQDLADKPLRARQRRPAGAVGRLRRRHDLARIEQLEIQRGRQTRVVEPGLALPHGVLMAAKIRQPPVDKIRQGPPRLRRRHRPVEGVQAPRMLRETSLHQREHLPRGRVGGKSGRRGHHARPRLRETLAVVLVVVPLAALRPARRVEQHAVAPPQFAVKKLQAELFPPDGMDAKLLDAGEKMPVGPHLEREAERLRRRLERAPDPPVARLGRHQPHRTQLGHRARQLARQRPGVVRRVELGVAHRPARRPPRVAKMAHRGEKERRARLARPHVLGLLRHLRHPDRVARRIGAVERRRIRVQLVAEHQHQIAHRAAHASRSVAPPRKVLKAAKASARASAWSTIGRG